jgi:hypothetical protein
VLEAAREFFILRSADDNLEENTMNISAPDESCSYDKFYRYIWSLEIFHSLGHVQDILRVISALLRVQSQEDILIHPRKQLRAALPRQKPLVDLREGWHQDYPEIQGALSTITAWAPLVPVGPRTGALAIVPGSHNNGIFPLRLASGPAGWEATVEPATVHSGELFPGDVLLFSPLTLHRPMPHTGNSFRLSMDVRYQPISEEISETCLQAFDQTYGWEDVYANWSESSTHRFYWTKYPIHVIPCDRSWDDWREAEALAAGRAGMKRACKALQLVAEFSPHLHAREEAARLLKSIAP